MNSLYNFPPKKIYFIPFHRDNNDTFYDMTNDFEILT